MALIEAVSRQGQQSEQQESPKESHSHRCQTVNPQGEGETGISQGDTSCHKLRWWQWLSGH